jgi:glucokinase
MTDWRIVCDVGGTNIRIARSDGPKQFSHLNVEATERCISLPAALQRFWRQFDDRDSFTGAAIAAAGPVEAGRVTLTNGPLTIERDAVSAEIGGKPVALFNDLEATAYAVPLLTAEDLAPVVAVFDPLAGPRLVVNVGTGFGAALLVQTTTGWQSVATEAGHMTLGGLEPRVGIERTASAAGSVEDRISGLALCGGSSRPLDRMPFSSDFGELFGAVCGNLVLATGAWGGVTLCGSVASAWCRMGDFQSFAAAFRDKGRMSKRMDRVPVSEIILPHPALIGLTAVGRF